MNPGASSSSSVSANVKGAAGKSAEEAKKIAEEVKGKTSSLKNFIGGGVGGVCAVLVGQPFDMVGLESPLPSYGSSMIIDSLPLRR